MSVCQHTQREPCMGLVKDKELLTRHRAQNTLAQLRTVECTVQVRWVPAHRHLWAGCAGGRAPWIWLGTTLSKKHAAMAHHCTHTASPTGSLSPARAIKSPRRLRASEPGWLPGSRHHSIASRIWSSPPEKGASLWVTKGGYAFETNTKR